MKLKSQAAKQCNALNAAIHNQNLFRAGRRYVAARVTYFGFGVERVQVQDLYSKELVDFVNDGSFTNCNGNPVTV
jgi:hypothetical protein